MSDRLIYYLILGFLILQRLSELYISKKNEKRLKQRGGYSVYSQLFKWMILMHVSWFTSCVALGAVCTDFKGGFFRFCSVQLLSGCQAVRFLSMKALRDRWSTQITVVPGEPVVTSGIYTWIRHPNYIVVVLEIALVPMLCRGWVTAVVFSVLNFFVLWTRIRYEERALLETSNYQHYAQKVPRFFPYR